MKRSQYTTCGYIVRKLAMKYSLNRVWLWDFLDNEFNMRGAGCPITWEEAEAFESKVIKAMEE